MNTGEVEKWLRRKVVRGTCSRVFLAVGAIVAGAVILFITYWIVYAVIFFGFNWAIPHSHATRCWISLAVVILLFVGNALTSREYLGESSFSTGTASDKPAFFRAPWIFSYVFGIGVVSNINPLAPDSMHSYAKIITDVLYSGPRILALGVKSFRKAYRLARLDVPGCAAVIAFLLAAGHRVSFIEISAQLPWLNFSRVFTDLRYVDGVRFLSKEPPGLALDSTTKEELLDAS